MTHICRKAPSCLPDDLSSLDACRRAAEVGDARAQCLLGLRYMEGDGVDRDPKEAVLWFRKAARLGHAEAQYNLGLAYEEGDGVRKSYPRALQWYKRAGVQKIHAAQYSVGRFWLLGLGVRADQRKAVVWLRLAARGGHDWAEFLLGIALSKDASTQEEAVVWLRKAADRGHSRALVRLAGIHDDALGPCHDPDAADALYRDAARQRSAAACLILGCKSAQGGDEVDAYTWWTLAVRYADPADDEIAWIAAQRLRNLTCGMDPALVEEAERRMTEWTRH
jgi:uncharacterized protein